MSEDKRLAPSSPVQLEMLGEAVDRYEDAFSVEAARFLLSKGIDEDLASELRLGVVDNPFPGHGKYRGWLAIPYLRHDGLPVSIRFRCIVTGCKHDDGWHGKYETVEGDAPRLYGIQDLHAAGDEIHVTEGEFDKAILQSIGLHAVGVPGASSWLSRHRRMLAGFSKVWVWGDPDDAGAKFITKVCRSLRQARGVQLVTGDVTDTYLAGGASALLELIEEGQ